MAAQVAPSHQEFSKSIAKLHIGYCRPVPLHRLYRTNRCAVCQISDIYETNWRGNTYRGQEINIERPRAARFTPKENVPAQDETFGLMVVRNWDITL